MAFKTGKQNAWHLKDAEIARLRAQIDDMRDQDYRRQFARDMGESIMTMLAVTPMAQWPDMAKVAFRHHSDKAPALAWGYKEWHERANESRVIGTVANR